MKNHKHRKLSAFDIKAINAAVLIIVAFCQGRDVSVTALATEQGGEELWEALPSATRRRLAIGFDLLLGWEAAHNPITEESGILVPIVGATDERYSLHMVVFRAGTTPAQIAEALAGLSS